MSETLKSLQSLVAINAKHYGIMTSDEAVEEAARLESILKFTPKHDPEYKVLSDRFDNILRYAELINKKEVAEKAAAA